MENKNVFVNCPFSTEYDCHFKAILYVLVRSGFVPRSAREEDDNGEVRYDKICRIIQQCQLGVHDISYTGLYGNATDDADFPLPRFNMPFELGLFFGAKNFGAPPENNKKMIIFDKNEHRFKKFLSDISGSDITPHASDIDNLIVKLASWLRGIDRQRVVPGGIKMKEEFARLISELPVLCQSLALEVEELQYHDFMWISYGWIKNNCTKPLSN